MRRINREVLICLEESAPQIVWMPRSEPKVAGSVDLGYWLRNRFFGLEPIALVASNSIIPLNLLEKR